MAFASPIVPMPRWSAAVGCTKLGLTIFILAFVAACIALWGTYAAFSITLFTAVFSLLSFAYYLIALSLKSSLYNKWLVLTLESLLTAFWLISLILLAGWTSESANMVRYLSIPAFDEPVSSLGHVDINRRIAICNPGALCLPPIQEFKRETVQVSSTPIHVHGQNAQAAARVLAGLSTGLAGLIFALYAATFITFALNFNKTASQPRPASDEETASQTHGDQPFSPMTPMTPAFTQPLRVDTLPREFEPLPQTQEHYLTPEQAANAGIEPPTPILKAQQADKEKEKERGEKHEEEKDAISLSAMLATAPSSAVKKKSHSCGE